MRWEEKPRQMWYRKNLWVCWLKPDVGLNKWKMVGGPIHGVDLIRSRHAVWLEDSQWSLVLLAQEALKTGPESWSLCEISGLRNEGGGDNLDGLQSKAIAKTGFGEIIQAFLGFWKVQGENDSDMLGLVGCLWRGMLIPVHTYCFWAVRTMNL